MLERGEGSWVFTVDGEKYLDFSTGTVIFESLDASKDGVEDSGRTVCENMDLKSFKLDMFVL